MSKHKGQFNGVMIGVGAGFDYYAGNIKRAPKIMQTLCLEWLYRLLQDPKRLWKRYVTTNIKFVEYVIKEKGKKHGS
jgi:N-acetylglucosaminyldiphosphoundecaprenol N-acetyl-beta-D-mannosaminyltransferase